MESKLQSQQQYPRFIQNKPCGIDKFDGGSQKRLAKTIARHFRQNDSLNEECSLPRIIGIEGIWGSGKSNVVKMLESELSDNYYFFEYDAWGHQEDLQRRSILELLTSKLIDDGILSGDATIKVKGGGSKTVSWSDKLKYLLARKTETVTEKYPLISNGMVAAFLVAVLTPIFTFIAYAVKPTPTTCGFSLLSIIIAALPVLIALSIWWLKYRKDPQKYGWSYLLAIYQDKIENDVCYETLSEDEPTVCEFKAWMQDISDFIKEKGQHKLVLVFDNMDRLPAEKVKELWSSIHTFFADSGFENVWAVIPFDETHLACAFGDETNEQTKQLTKYFINKTFPIVYRVAPPVITDYRNIVDKFFVEAFGEEGNDESETINRIFRLVNPNANVREIISFINEMVALRQEWSNEISMINIALFCLKKAEILANPAEQILSGDYLNGIQTIINNNLQTQREIAALVYGVDVEHARQIPLKKYIEGCINGEDDHDINQYANTNKQFDIVLDEVIKGIDDALVDKIIHCLHTLTRKNDTILHIWQRIAKLKLKEPIDEQAFPVEYQELLLHLDTENQNHVIAQLYKKVVRFKDFNGGDYFKTLNEIDRFIEQNKLSCDFASLIEAKTVESNTFIDYIKVANKTHKAYRDDNTTKAYEYYQVKTNSEALDTYLSNLLPDNFDHADIVKTLKSDSAYTFPTLLQTIMNCIKTKGVNKDNLGAIFTTYRLLASDEERPLSVTLDSTYINQLHSELNTDGRNIEESGYYDLVAMQLAHGRSVSLIESGDIKYVAKIMDYYVNHGDLLIKSVGWNNSLLNDTLQYMVKNKLGYKLSLIDILPQFENIKNRISVTEDAFIEHLAEWDSDLDEHLSKNNIQIVIPRASFYSLTTKISNVLTDHINKIAIEALSEVSSNTLYAQKANHASNYWLVATNHLLTKIKSLPDNLTEFGKKILIDIASGTQNWSSLPDCFKNIIERLDKRKIKSTVTDIRNDFCIGKKTINAIKFQFFEPWLRTHGNLKSQAGEVIDKIVKPVISDGACRSLILQNKDFYMDLINIAGDDAYELKKSLKNLSQKDSNPQLIEFVNSIDSVPEVETA
ncbi:MAG: NTPase [Muribaculaceae bacterium]|nr:NTPase [Muribaculaceae bacterium]